jgi:hypothetical protein
MKMQNLQRMEVFSEKTQQQFGGIFKQTFIRSRAEKGNPAKENN